jgi:hypothetical protein
MAKKRRSQSIGEMISSVTFFGLAIYAMLLAFAHMDEGSTLKAAGSWIAMILCGAASIRFMIADWVERIKRWLA